MVEILTIGHSTLSYEEFLRLLREADVTAVADVRSSPYSRHFPQFNADVLKNELRLDKIAFSPLGKELGGRPRNSELFCDGIADYEKMAEQESFKSGVQRVMTGASRYRIALMCSEHNPLDCHRCLLVSRALGNAGAVVKHIQSSGRIISQNEIEQQLLDDYGRDDDMFAKSVDRTALAYRKRSLQISYRVRSSSGKVAAA